MAQLPVYDCKECTCGGNLQSPCQVCIAALRLAKNAILAFHVRTPRAFESLAYDLGIGNLIDPLPINDFGSRLLTIKNEGLKMKDITLEYSMYGVYSDIKTRLVVSLEERHTEFLGDAPCYSVISQDDFLESPGKITQETLQFC